jgi:prophage regulatory protein
MSEASTSTITPTPRKATINDVKIIRMPELVTLLGVSKSVINCLADPNRPEFDPNFPKKINISNRSTGWFESEIITWLNGLAAKRDDNG